MGGTMGEQWENGGRNNGRTMGEQWENNGRKWTKTEQPEQQVETDKTESTVNNWVIESVYPSGNEYVYTGLHHKL